MWLSLAPRGPCALSPFQKNSRSIELAKYPPCFSVPKQKRGCDAERVTQLSTRDHAQLLPANCGPDPEHAKASDAARHDHVWSIAALYYFRAAQPAARSVGRSSGRPRLQRIFGRLTRKRLLVIGRGTSCISSHFYRGTGRFGPLLGFRQQAVSFAALLSDHARSY